MKTYLYSASNLKSTCQQKTVISCNLFIIIIINFFRRVFSEYTEAVTTSLVPIDAILPENCTFIIGFSCIVWTKMRSLWAL